MRSIKIFIKYWIGILIIISGFYSYAQKPSIDLLDKIAETKAKQSLKSINFTENNTYKEYDLIYQRMEWEIDPSVKFIKGKVTSSFVCKKEEINSVQFDLDQVLNVDSVLWRGDHLNFTHQGNILKISLKTVLNVSDIDSVSVYYQGIPLSSGFGAFIQHTHNSIPIIWTLSEPYGAKEWWPCKQSLVDKVDSIDIIVTCPELYRTASNGVLVSETAKGGKRIMHWKHRYPIATYLIAIAVTNYVDYSDYLELEDGKVIEILNYVYPENYDEARVKTPHTIDIMALFNDLFGLYPFADEKYGHAQFGWGGGMEHQTMSFMYNFEFGLTAHELAHQWFGDYITLASWHDIWLNEGFATYATGLAYENLLEGVWWTEWRESLISRITGDSGGSVYVKDTTNISRIFNSRLSYSKGAYLLHMLRWVLGDEIFFEAINNYLKDPEITNGFASQEKLVYHLQNAGDTILTEFFNDWYYGEGFPIYSVEYSQNSENQVRIKLFQETSHNSVDFFEMPVEVRLISGNESDSLSYRLENYYSGQEFILNPGFKIRELKIDPELWLISKTNSNVSVPWLYNSDEILIYPNPVANNLSIYVSGEQIVEKVDILTLKGMVLKSFKGNIQTINIFDLPNGVYLIQISTSSGMSEQKIIKY